MAHGSTVSGGEGTRNHPLALRMGIVAFLAHNVIVGSIFGTTGVLLKPMMARLGVPLGLASLGAPMVMVGSAALSALAGALAARFTLRALLLGSAAMLAAGWVVLGATHSFALYLVAYGLLLGPALAIGGAVLPPTLVTRWFHRNRGLAIGLAHMSVVIAIMPLVANWVIGRYGVQPTFLVLAAFALVVLVPAALLIIERPPAADVLPAAAMPIPGGLTIGQLLASRAFWLLAIAIAVPNTGSVLLGIHLVSMAERWGFTREQGALLTSVMSLFGIAGFILFGWLSDRLGGARTLALIACDQALLWGLLLLPLPFPALLGVVGVIGLHGAGTVPAMSKALAHAFGADSFSRAYGLGGTGSLPIMVIGVAAAGHFVETTGSYTDVIVAMIAVLALAAVLALLAARVPPKLSPDGSPTTAAR